MSRDSQAGSAYGAVEMAAIVMSAAVTVPRCEANMLVLNAFWSLCLRFCVPEHGGGHFEESHRSASCSTTSIDILVSHFYPCVGRDPAEAGASRNAAALCITLYRA